MEKGELITWFRRLKTTIVVARSIDDGKYAYEPSYVSPLEHTDDITKAQIFDSPSDIMKKLYSYKSYVPVEVRVEYKLSRVLKYPKDKAV